jgi:hypothetical protein
VRPVSEQIYSFIKVDHDLRFNPNVYRYYIYNEFLELNSASINNIFFTDISDVVVLKNPFLEQLYIDNPTSIFLWRRDQNTQ